MTRTTIKRQAREMARRALRDSRGDWYGELSVDQEFLSWAARNGVVPDHDSRSTFRQAYEAELQAGQRGTAKTFRV